jgi:outer membrane protein assembly factor BamB
MLCVVNGLTGGEIYTVRPGGDGDVTETHRVWNTPRQGSRDCPSPIVVDKYILVSDMKGVAACYDAADGRVYWRERLGGNLSASPIAANGLVYFLNEEGKTFVLEPGPRLKVVARNTLPAGEEEIFRASPTPSDGQLFLRSTTMLYCIGTKQQ